MMVWLRSLAFYGLFCLWLIACGLIFLPTLCLPRSYALKAANFWLKSFPWLCKSILGIHVQIEGQENLSHSPVIYAAKHQSAWETVYLYILLKDPSIVLKKELLWIPFLGWFLKKLGMISLTRSRNKGVQDLKNLLNQARKSISSSKSLLIFPEGTRALPGKKSVYHSGVSSLYQHLKVPVVPISHNAGLFWPRRGFLKNPGQITVSILPPIQPGLSRNEFMHILEKKIETKTNHLVKKGLTNAEF